MRIYMALGVGALAALSYNLRETLPIILPDRVAPREAELVVEAQQEFALKGDIGRVGGLGVVRFAPDAVKWLVGQKVSYSARWPLPEKIENGEWIRIKGVLTPLGYEEAIPPSAPPENFHHANHSKKKNPVKIKTDDGFDDYLRRLHVFWDMSRGTALKIEKPANPLMHWVAGLHELALKILRQRWNAGDNNGLLPAMVLGDKSGLTPKQLENLSRSSTTHLIVADGLNVMAVAAVLWVIVRLTGVSRVAQSVLVVLGLGVYALMVGAAPSVLRAWGMVAIVLGAWAGCRQMNLWAVLVLAATVSLLVEPLSFLQAGWRLSFSVVGGIILGINTVERWGVLEKLRGPMGWAARVCAVSIAASLAVAPLTIAYWGIAQPIGFLVNAVTVSLGEMVKILGTASFVFGWLPWVFKTINEAAYWLIGWIEGFIEFYLKIPGAVVNASAAKASGIEVWGTIGVLTVFYLLARWGWPKRNPNY